MAQTLQSIHDMLAVFAAADELRLADDEAKRLATALHDVSKHYRVPMLSPDKMALAVLVWTAGGIYVPKVKAIADRKAGRLPARSGGPHGPAVTVPASATLPPDLAPDLPGMAPPHGPAEAAPGWFGKLN